MIPRTDQHRLLADAAREFSAEHTPARLRACRLRDPEFDRTIWTAIAQLGWLGLLVDEADGGLGATFEDMGQLVYAWGRACAPEPLVASAVLALRTLALGDGPARSHLLQQCIDGSHLLALAADSITDPTNISVTYAQGVLNGTCRFVVPAHADGYLVATHAGVFHVLANSSGFSLQRETRADGSAAAWITLSNVAAPPVQRVASNLNGCLQAIDEARILCAIEMSGMAARMLELTLEYLRTREQFGQAIGRFQALQHRAVDLYLAEQLARDVTQAACIALDTPLDTTARHLLACRAKARANTSLNRIAREAVQLHGAMGFTDEYQLGLYVNRTLTLSAWLGNTTDLQAEYAAHANDIEVLSA